MDSGEDPPFTRIRCSTEIVQEPIETANLSTFPGDSRVDEIKSAIVAGNRRSRKITTMPSPSSSMDWANEMLSEHLRQLRIMHSRDHIVVRLVTFIDMVFDSAQN